MRCAGTGGGGREGEEIEGIGGGAWLAEEVDGVEVVELLW